MRNNNRCSQILLSLLVIACLFCSLNVSAALIPILDKNYNYDDVSGLYWLRLTATINQSYDQVTNGVWYSDGWRHATADEIISFYSTNLPSLVTTEVVPDPNYPTWVAGDYWAEPQVNPQGEVEVQTLLNIMGTTSFNQGAVAIGIFGRKLSCVGCTAHGMSYFGYSIVQGNKYLQADMTGSATDYYGVSYAGHFLVHDSTLIPAVPLPAAFWLFGSGLLGLIGLARRKAA